MAAHNRVIVCIKLKRNMRGEGERERERKKRERETKNVSKQFLLLPTTELFV